jgi:hypothetical protein
MNASWLLAFVVTPLTVLALGWIAVLLHERSLRSRRGHPRAAK